MPDFSETLISPDGREFTARSASEYNDLRFGQGYRPAGEVSGKSTKSKSTKAASKSESTPEQTS